MNAMDRHKARVQEISGAEILGETSDDVKTYVPLAAGAIAEIAAQQLKNKEQAAAKAKLESGEAFQAQKLADDLNKKAAMASIDASTETDANGPKHRAAAELNLQALAATQKAMYFKQQAMMSQMPGSTAMTPPGYGMPKQESSIFTTKNILIGVGVLGLLGVVVYAVRK